MIDDEALKAGYTEEVSEIMAFGQYRFAVKSYESAKAAGQVGDCGGYAEAFAAMHDSLKEPLNAWYKSQGLDDEGAALMADAHCVEIGTEFRHVIQTTRATPEGESGWQPIETAPRDNTLILLWWPHWSDKPVVGKYYTDSYADNKWQADCCFSDTPEEPTHWMPLPTPPSNQMGGGES